MRVEKRSFAEQRDQKRDHDRPAQEPDRTTGLYTDPFSEGIPTSFQAKPGSSNSRASVAPRGQIADDPTEQPDHLAYVLLAARGKSERSPRDRTTSSDDDRDRYRNHGRQRYRGVHRTPSRSTRLNPTVNVVTKVDLEVGSMKPVLLDGLIEKGWRAMPQLDQQRLDEPSSALRLLGSQSQ